MTAKGPEIFRKEALDSYRRGSAGHGDPLRIAPSWTRWTFWLLIATVVAGLVYALVGTVDVYAEGPAVIHVEEAGPEPACTVVGLLAAPLGKEVRPGTPARFHPDGFPGVAEIVATETVAEQLVSRSDAARLLSAEETDPVIPTGPLVRLEARLPDCDLELEGRKFTYHEGMRGVIEARVRSERILVTLLPGLRRLSGSVDE